MKKTKLIKLVGSLSLSLAALCCCLPTLGQAKPTASKNTEQKTTTATRTHHFTLPNGLQIIVREDHRSPVVVNQVWYKIGAAQ